jgi:hypothetical protein
MITGKKIASTGLSDSIAENLERRFAALEKSGYSYNLILAEREYIDYLEREKPLRPIIKAIFADGSYDDIGLHIIFVLSMTTRGFTGAPKIPGFLEELYPEGVAWHAIVKLENNRREIASYAAIEGPIDADSMKRAREIVSDLTFRNDLSVMRRLHNLLLERLTESHGVTRTNNPVTIKIQSVRLEGRLLVINNGQITVPFNSKKMGKREEADELKTFKVFKLLWAGHFKAGERGGTNNKNARMVSAANLMSVGGVKKKDSFNRLIGRINKKFSDAGLRIKIEGKLDQYKLTVNYG